MIDASTCLFPDRTWFLKNNEHQYMSTSINPLIEKISRGNGNFTVWSDENWPQYVTYHEDTDTFTPGVAEDKTSSAPPKDFISTILRFFTNFFRWFKNAFKKIFNK